MDDGLDGRCEINIDPNEWIVRADKRFAQKILVLARCCVTATYGTTATNRFAHSSTAVTAVLTPNFF